MPLDGNSIESSSGNSLGIGVKVLTLPVIALGVGIGVGYALYVLLVVLVHLKQGESLSNADCQAPRFTSRVIVLTSLTLGITVVTWSFLPIKFQELMGILPALIFLGNKVGALNICRIKEIFLLSPRTVRVRLANPFTSHFLGAPR